MSTRTWLVPLLLLACAPAARADELSWDPEHTWRYDLTVRDAPGNFPVPLRLSPLRLVTYADLKDGRTPSWPLSDAGDLVWHYALELPQAEVPRKKAEVQVDETFAAQGGDLHVRGKQELKRKGKKLLIQAELDLEPTQATSTIRGGHLSVQRVFDLKQRRMLQAVWSLSLTAQLPKQQPLTGTWAGSLKAGEATDPAQPAFHAQVEQAIQRGASWLHKELGKRLQGFKKSNPDVYAQGRIALPVFALLRSGVDPAQLDETFAWLRAQPFSKTYSVSLYLMALEARSIRRQALPPRGETRSVARFDRGQPPPADLAEIERAAAWLLAARSDKGWWSYGGQLVDGVPKGPSSIDGKSAASYGDRSNSQFAILALHSALAAGAKLPAAAWSEVLEELLGAQAKDGPLVPLDDELAANSPLAYDARDLPPGTTTERGGGGLSSEELEQGQARGWSYSMVTRASEQSAYGSMSAAGLSSLAVAREGLREARALKEEDDRKALLGIRDGLAWVAHHFDVTQNPGRGSSNYFYYLYSLEKAMDLVGVERVGGHEWWREGAALLLQLQGADGSWENKNYESTCFALLFLNRATLPARLDVEAIGPVATGERDAALWDQVAIEGVGKVRARQLLRLLLRTGPRELEERMALADQVLAAMDPALAMRLVPELIELLERGPKPVQRWAEKACRELCGEETVAGAARFAERYEQLYERVEGGDTARGIPAAREALQGKPSPALERAALWALARLHAVEAAPDVIELLATSPAARRQAAHACLLTLVGAQRPFEPEAGAHDRQEQVQAWRDWWRDEGQQVLTAERVRRLLAELGDASRAAAAQKALAEIGQPAVRPLIDVLRDPQDPRLKRAHALLQSITGQSFPAKLDPWLKWWDARR